MERSSASAGLLLLRAGLGMMFVAFHGGPKLLGGAEVWGKVGMAMGSVGIHAFPAFWGFMAACAEFFGGVSLLLGLFTRPASLLMGMTMAVAAVMHLTKGDGILVASHAIEDGMVFFSLSLIGAGYYSLDRLLFSQRSDPSRYTLP